LRRRYLTRLLLPPALVSLPLAILFLWQVLQIDSRNWLYLAVIGLLTFCSAAVWIGLQLSPELEALERNQGEDRSALLSRCLQKTLDSSMVGWGLAATAFAILSTIFVQRSGIAFSYFLVASLIAAGPSICWNYGAGKAILLRESFRVGTASYQGREISLAKKIAIVFIGFFILSALSLILLISSRVSTALEKLAISSSSQWFERSYQKAAAAPKVDSEELKKLKEDLPEGYSVYRFLANGTVIAPSDETAAFDQDELRHVLAIQNGDSSTYVAPHVMAFRQLPDGTILAVSTPWAPYKNIPRQIAFYTFIIALLTTGIFSMATYFLSREVASPLNQLRRLATAMAAGDFTVQPRIFTDDEMGMLAASFGTSRDNLRLLLGRIGGSGSTITDGVKVMTAGTENLLLRAREQTALTKTSSTAVLNVRAGTESVLHAAETVTDLSVDASSRATELLASAEEVGRSMDHLFQSVEKSSSSTTEMDAAAREMSKRTEVLANIGEEVLSFVVEMDATVAQLRTTAQETADLSRKVREEASEGFRRAANGRRNSGGAHLHIEHGQGRRGVAEERRANQSNRVRHRRDHRPDESTGPQRRHHRSPGWRAGCRVHSGRRRDSRTGGENTRADQGNQRDRQGNSASVARGGRRDARGGGTGYAERQPGQKRSLVSAEDPGQCGRVVRDGQQHLIGSRGADPSQPAPP